MFRIAGVRPLTAVTLFVIAGSTSAATFFGSGFNPTSDAAFANPYTYAPSTIDFADYTLPASYPNEYNMVYPGVTSHTKDNVVFSTAGTGNMGVRNWGGSWGQTVRNTLQGSYYNIAETIRFDFINAVDVFAMNIGSIGASWTLSAYDSSDALLDSMTLNGAYDYFGISSSNISYAVLQSTGSDEILIDNISYAHVPVPAVPALLLTGLLGIHGLRKYHPVAPTNAD